MATYSFACASKYLETCESQVLASEMSALKNHIGGIVGNDCALLTGDLYCSGDLEVTNACAWSSAETCFENIDPSMKNENDLGTKEFCL